MADRPETNDSREVELARVVRLLARQMENEQLSGAIERALRPLLPPEDGVALDAVLARLPMSAVPSVVAAVVAEIPASSQADCDPVALALADLRRLL